MNGFPPDILERISDAFVALDREWRYTYVNRRAGELFGRDPESLIGKHIWTEFPEGVGQRFHLAYEQAMRTQEPITLEEFYPPWNRWYENRIYPSPEGLSIFFSNVTERKQADAWIRESEERLALALSGAGQGLWDWNVATGACYRSPEFHALLGYLPGEIQPHIDAWKGLVHPDDLAGAVRALQEAHASPANEYATEYRLRTREGGWRWFQDRGMVVERTPEGSPLRMIGVIQDVTSRKEAEWRIRESEERYRALFDTSMDAVYAIGRDGRYTYANQACARITGHPLETLLQLGFGSVIAPDCLAFTAEMVRRTMEGESHAFDTAIVRADGARVDISVSIVPQHGTEGIVGVFGISRDITERKAAEEQLRRSEERYRLVSRATQDVLYDWDVLQGELYWSDALESVFGYDPAESSGIEFWKDRIHPEDTPRVMEQVQRVLDGHDESLEVEYRFRRADGSWAHSLDRAYLERDAQGQPLRMVGSFLDLTERLEAERALRRSELRFRTLVEASSALVWIVDASGLIREAVPDWSAFTGQRFEEYRDWGWLEAIHPDDRAETAEAWKRAVETRGTYLAEHRLRRYDGEFRHMLARGIPILNEDGGVREWIGTHTDVTERKQAEQALRESEESYRLFFEEDISGNYVAAPDGTIVQCNRAFVRMFGFASREEALATRMQELHRGPEARGAILQALHRDGKVELQELEMKRRDGSPLHVMKNVIGIFDASGALVGTRGYLVDITEHRQLEEQLRQAQKMEAVGQLAGGVAHDFNNMLTAIIGHTQMLLAGPADEQEVTEGLQEIARAAERSAALTRQLLAFSRRQVLMPKPTDLNTVVGGMEGMLRRLIGEHIEVRTALASGLGEVFVDPRQVEQVLMNLVVNARDAMPQGGTMTISTSEVEVDGRGARLDGEAIRPGRYAVLSVADTGCGMDEATRERIWEPFFTTKEVGQGTGLGLSTVYGIVKQSEGGVRVESVPGSGSTFHVYLPRLEARAGAAERALRPRGAEIGTETVLLVEDETAVRKLVGRVLRASGYTVLEATDGAEAIRRAEEHPGPIHLMLCDMVMPGMSGLDVARTVMPRIPTLKVLLMSGYSSDAVEEHGTLEAGTAFIQKPFTPEALCERVRRILDGRDAS